MSQWFQPFRPQQHASMPRKETSRKEKEKGMLKNIAETHRQEAQVAGELDILPQSSVRQRLLDEGDVLKGILLKRML